MVPVDGTTLVDHRVFVLGGVQETLNGSATFEVGLYAIPTTDLFDAFTKTVCVGYDNVTLVFSFISGRLGTCGAPISGLSGGLVKSFLHLVQSPFGIFAFGENLPEMVFFLLEQFCLLQDSTNRMRNLHQNILQEYGLEALHLFQDWERLWLRASNYKNHRIFTLRCIHKELIPVSIKLKSTLKTEKAEKIVRKAEKDLLQARVKAINSILDNVTKQTELCRSQLASILSAERLRECQGFIEKVGEIRFTKVKQRQVNKFNNLNKKEENITRVSPNNSSPNLVSQTGSQVGTLLPPGEGSNLAITQSGRQAGALLPPGEESSLVATQAGSQAVTPQTGTPLHTREGSNLATTQTGRQSGTLLPPREGSSITATQAGSFQAGRSVTSLSPKEGGSPVAFPASQAGALLPTGEGSTPAITQAVLSSPGDGASSQAGSEVTTHTPAGEVLPKQVTPP